MSLILHYHPLSSFCQKALIALYENDTPFQPLEVDLGDEVARTAFRRLWPIGKFPLLQDCARDRLVPESSLIIEYLDRHYPGRARLIPGDPEQAFRVRERDRFYDLYVNQPMQKIVTDRLRPTGQGDAFGVAQARELLRTAYTLIEREMSTQTWAAGDFFSMADCAAAPALFYADRVLALSPDRPHAAAYLARLKQRDSYARALAEAQPYFSRFPGEA